MEFVCKAIKEEESGHVQLSCKPVKSNSNVKLQNKVYASFEQPAKKAEPKTEKAEQKAETKKAETKKAETKKVEEGKIEPQSITETFTQNGVTVILTLNTAEITRTYDWSLTCQSQENPITLSEGQIFDNAFLLTGEVTFSDSQPRYTGSITIINGSQSPLRGLSVAAAPQGTIIGPIPTLLESGGQVTAGIEIQYDGISQAIGANVVYTQDGILRRIVAFFTYPPQGLTPAIREVDESAMVQLHGNTDVLEANGVRQASLTAPVGPYAECGEYVASAEATLTTNDTGSTVVTDCSVNVIVPCDTGCVLSQGYWRTHSQRGPAPYDDTWALIGPDQENTPFFISGQTYFEALTVPVRGNAYYILARQYIAAQLNQLNGASIEPFVLDIFGQATVAFETFTPQQIAQSSSNSELRQRFIAGAQVLELYNTGFEGTPACDENSDGEQTGRCGQTV